MAHILAGRHYVRGDWTRQSLYALSPRTVSRRCEALPRPVEVDDLHLSRSATPSGRAPIDGLARASWSSAARARRRAISCPVRRSRSRSAARGGGGRRYGIGAYEMGQGAIVFASGERVEGRDLGGPGRARDRRGRRGEAGDARLAGRGGVRCRRCSPSPATRRCASASRQGTASPTSTSLERRRLRDVRGRAAARRRRGARAGAHRRRARRPAAACW